MLLVLPAFVWVILAGLLLFGLLVIVRLTFDLARSVKGLAGSVRKGSARLKTAVAEVQGEVKEASERASRVGAKTSRKPASRRG